MNGQDPSTLVLGSTGKTGSRVAAALFANAWREAK